MQRPKLVIASVLKPVTDTRMYEKFALSISQAKKYEVNIIGFYTKNLPDSSGIYFHPIFQFKRISWARLLAPIQFLLKLWRLQPEVVIINTHELLLPAIVFKIFRGGQLFYDVRENYYFNILYTPTFPAVIKTLIAVWVRCKEWLALPFINHFILAERAYAEELPFLKKKYSIIENKSTIIVSKYPRKFPNEVGTLQLLFTGTISSTTGIFEAIKLTEKLHEKSNQIRLIIMGFCARKNDLKRLKNLLKDRPYINLIGGENQVPHHDIIEAIKMADFGLVYYPKNKANDRLIPTKFYEYTSAQLPIIYDYKAVFAPLAKSYKAGISIDYNHLEIEELLGGMLNHQFYTTDRKLDVFWTSEATKLMALL